MHLKVWFERYGTGDGKFIRYKKKTREVDTAVMARQGKLHAGPLYGSLVLSKVDDATIGALREKRQSDPQYLELAKQIVKLAVPKLARFVMILRTVYGQYWLEEVPEWDSRKQSLGSYCKQWGMRWSLDQEAWEGFEPDRPSAALEVDGRIRRDFSCYITNDDWTKLGDLVRSDYEPSDAIEIGNRSRNMLQEGHSRC